MKIEPKYGLVQYCEEKLAEVDSQEFKYIADKPYLLRVLYEYFTGRPDEILTQSRITKHEVKKMNRSERLLEVDGQLAEVSIIIVVKQNQTKEIESTVSVFRSARFDMGQNYRMLRNLLKQQTLKFNGDEILEKFTRNLQVINEAATRMLKFAEDTRDSAGKCFSELDRIQKQMLLPASKSDSFNQIGNDLEEIVENLKSKK